MKNRWILLIVCLGLGLMPAGLALAYGNHAARGDWQVGGPHRTVNALALAKYIEQAGSDPLLARYDFKNESLKVRGPTIGEPHMFTPGREDKMATFQWWVIEGGYTADEPELYASFRHFYDPRHEEMERPPYLTDHLEEAGGYFKAMAAFLALTGNPVSAAVIDEIGRNPQVDARAWAINGPAGAGWGENEYSWNKGLEAMDLAFESRDEMEKSRHFAQAWRALGETMHLLADMTTPAHVRNDSHPGVAFDWKRLPPELRNANPNEGFLKGDAYETWASGEVINSAGRAGVSSETQAYIKNSRNALDLFDRVALFTNASVFSSDTIAGIDVSGVEVHSANGMPDYPAPRLSPDQYDPETGTYTKRIGDRDVCLAHASWLSEIGWGKAHPRITYRCTLSQAKLLVPVAVAGNARLLDWFVPRVKVEITDVDPENQTMRGTFTHQPSGPYKTALTFNTAPEAFNRLYLNGMIQDWEDYRITVDNNLLTVTYGDKTARNIDSARQGGGGVVVSVMIDVGGLGVRSNDFALTPVTPTPSPSPSLIPELADTSGNAGNWVLQEILTHQEKQEESPCYFDHQFTIGDGSFASSGGWTDKGCVEGGDASGSVSVNCTWSPPPSYLKAGEEVILTGSCQGSAQQTGGDRSMGGSVNLTYTEDPPEDCLACFLSWTNTLFHVAANGWTSTYPLSASETAGFTVPEGQPGDLLSIVAGCNGPGGNGWVAYKYVSDATEPPPARTPPPTVPPVADTPTPTVEPATATPPPTETPTPEPSSTPARDTLPEPEPDNSPPEYGPATFGTGYDYNSLELLDPGHDFGPGLTVLYAGWPYRDVTAGTTYEYEWYRNGQLLETNRNMLFHDVGRTFDFYTPDPGAQQPLKPGNYVYRVTIEGQPVLSAECVVR